MSNPQSLCLGGLDVNSWDQLSLLVDTCCLHGYLSSLLLLIVDSTFVPAAFDRCGGETAARFQFLSRDPSSANRCASTSSIGQAFITLSFAQQSPLPLPMSPAKRCGEWEVACRDSRHSTHPDRKEDIIFENCGSWRRVFGGMGTLQDVKIHLVAEDITPGSCFLLG